ncbi:hypothetical protein BKA82DRAFT_1003678 [Pisolithus tinctorius]|uniref:Secreted protein n=1 Tax=Pisolithus tinctorius Marx 270 TaxID=870435 RepID=A0A0C3IUY4_PISTI|nr:hypothetical protein BKA82DRAFT_1003678 [Pisolithus tinctorius]KIO00678.1 hypothetical protein M404DRAFT_1003678 [Pisolithus tinctorius Marx 270]
MLLLSKALCILGLQWLTRARHQYFLRVKAIKVRQRAPSLKGPSLRLRYELIKSADSRDAFCCFNYSPLRSTATINQIGALFLVFRRTY